MSSKYHLLFKIVILCLFLQATSSAAEKNNKKSLYDTLKQPECEKAVTIIAKDYKAALESLTYALDKVKESAEKKNNVDEVIRIKALLNGEGHQTFSSSSAIRAQETFEKRLRSAIEKALPELKLAISSSYEKANKENTENLKKLISTLEESLQFKSYIRKTGKLNANVQQMKSGVFVKKGSEIEICASGKWRPGGWRGKKGRTHNPEYGDADTYNIALSIDGKYIGKGGKKWKTTARKSGELLFQMAGHNARKGGAAGYQNLQLTVITPAVLKEQMAFAESCLKISDLENDNDKANESEGSVKKSSSEKTTGSNKTADTDGPIKIADMENCSNICKFIFSRRKNIKNPCSWLWNNLTKDTQSLILDISLQPESYPTDQHKKIIAEAFNDIIKREGKRAENKVKWLIRKGGKYKGRKK